MDERMIVERELMVINQAGLHLRVASKIVKLLNDFNCDAAISFDGRVANGKSIMSLTQLIAPPGSILKLKITGPDAYRAAVELEKLFRNKFEED
jgi:phosphocarrier protein HPr